MNESQPFQTQHLTNNLHTNFDNSVANLLSHESHISLPHDQDKEDFQNIIDAWDALNAKDSPEDPNFTIENKATRINPRKAIHQRLNPSTLDCQETFL